MYCIVCHYIIRINRLQELLTIKELFLCSQCQSQLRKKSAYTLYEKNHWLEVVVTRLNHGDICLNQIFFHSLRHAILRHLNVIKEITVLETATLCPYPWLDILVTDIKATFPQTALKGEKTLFIIQEGLIDDKLAISII